MQREARAAGQRRSCCERWSRRQLCFACSGQRRRRGRERRQRRERHTAGTGGSAGGISAGAGGSGGTQPNPDGGAEINVLTFNVRTKDADSADAQLGNAWASRLPLALAVLSDHAPDVVGLQEATDQQVTDISAGFAVLPAPDVSVLYDADLSKRSRALSSTSANTVTPTSGASATAIGSAFASKRLQTSSCSSTHI